jgi:hypothetical protein
MTLAELKDAFEGEEGADTVLTAREACELDVIILALKGPNPPTYVDELVSYARNLLLPREERNEPQDESEA